MDHQALLKQFEHLNHLNPEKFESTDLDMLIKAVRILPNEIVFLLFLRFYNMVAKLVEVQFLYDLPSVFKGR